MSENKNRGALGALFSLGALADPGIGLDSLSKIVYPPEVNGLYYRGKILVLDGYRFTNCRFDNCTLQVSTTNFSLVHCVIDDLTTIQYGGDTLKLVKLFNSRFE